MAWARRVLSFSAPPLVRAQAAARASPSCALLPGFLLVLMLSAGLHEASRAASAAELLARGTASHLAEQAGLQLMLQLQAAFVPGLALSAMVRQTPYWPDLRERFQSLGQDLVALVRTGPRRCKKKRPGPVAGPGMWAPD